MSMSDTEVRDAVRALMRERGLPLTDDEFEGWVRTYETMRTIPDSLRMPEVRYTSPDMVYRAALER